MNTAKTLALGVVGAIGLFAGSSMAAPSWGAPAKDVALFYPGQSSWEWVLTPSDHPGADKFKGGKTCAACHIGDEKNMGALLASGKKNEPTPIAGKPGSMDAKVQFSHDADTLYVKITFSEAGQPNAHMDNAHEAKVTMMLAGEGTPEAGRAGCWGMCHDDSAAMPSAGGAQRTMYLGKTRAQVTRSGGGDALKAGGDLAKLKAAGYEVEFWQAQLSGSSATSADEVVFDKRAEVKPGAVSATATKAGATWTVVLSRKLSAGPVPVAAGHRYTVGFAIHAGHAAKRFHYVSFERSLVLDQGAADFVAK